MPGLPAGQTECEAAGCCWDGDSTCYHRLPARRYTARLAGAGGNQVGRQLTTRYTGVQSWGEVEVPDLPPGEYVLSFRWDCEQTSQIWNACSNIRIID